MFLIKSLFQCRYNDLPAALVPYEKMVLVKEFRKVIDVDLDNVVIRKVLPQSSADIRTRLYDVSFEMQKSFLKILSKIIICNSLYLCKLTNTY